MGVRLYWYGIHALWLLYAGVGAVLGGLVGWLFGDAGLGAFIGGMVGFGVAVVWLVAALAWRRRTGRRSEQVESFVK
jgi:hypothetical protein